MSLPPHAPSPPEPVSPRLVRLCGGLYLAIIGLGLLGEVGVRQAMVVPGDAAATAQAIAASPGWWRVGLGADLLMHLLDVPVMVLLHLLLRPAGPGLALFTLSANLVQTAVLALNKLSLVLPLLLLQGGNALQGLALPQREALAYLAIQVHGRGFAIGLLFFGMVCLARGHLIVRSAGWPRLLGRLLQLAGLCYLVNSLALLLKPDWAALLFPAVLLPAFVAELWLALWLLFKGPRPA